MIGTWQVGTYRRVGHHVASERSIVREASAADGAVVRLAGKFQPTPGMQEWVELVILRTVQIDEAEVRISDSEPLFRYTVQKNLFPAEKEEKMRFSFVKLSFIDKNNVMNRFKCPWLLGSQTA